MGLGCLGGVVGLAVLASACGGGHLADGFYVNPTAGFRVPVPAAPWTPLDLPEVEFAYRHPRAGTIAAASSCEGTRGVPLRILARRLFFGLKGLEVVDRAPLWLNGAEGLRTVVRGLLDGKPVVVETVVARRGPCAVDLMLAAPPEAFPALRPELERMVAGWTPLE